MSASASVVGSDDTALVGALPAQEDLDDMLREATEEDLHEADNDATQAVDNDVQPGLFFRRYLPDDDDGHASTFFVGFDDAHTSNL